MLPTQGGTIQNGRSHLLDEDFAQARLTEGVIFEVEAVKAVECVLVRMHVQRVHVQIIPVTVHEPTILST